MLTTKLRTAATLAMTLLGVGQLSAAESTAQQVKLEQKPDRLVVYVGGKVFTEYLFLETEKYPYFYPVNGPLSGKSITTRREKNYPHHSSLFFGCDRVNGGNYWQEGLERGRIVHKGLKVARSEGPEVVWEQDCRWERPGAESPFDDHRKIAISAPSPEVRHIDFEVKLTVRIKVRIEKTNHSLFSGRVAPDLCVQQGGSLINAQGDQGEKATFGKKSPWMDYRGKRGDRIEGIAILDHPSNPWHPPPWFTRDYGFFSPTPMNWLEQGFVELAAGDQLRLRYRVIVHGNNPSPEQLNAGFEQWSKK